MDTAKALLLDDDSVWSRMEVINESGVQVDRSTLREHLRNSPEVAAITDWVEDIHSHTVGGRRRTTSIFERDRYVTPHSIYAQFRVAADGAESDDAVSGVLESTEGLAFAKMRMESSDEDQEDVWNQVAADLDLDSRLREMWREMFIYSQVVVATYWGRKTYKVRGTTKKEVRRKKTLQVNVPLGMTMLDPLKVAPVGNFFFNREKLVYLADADEFQDITDTLEGRIVDPLISEIMTMRYTPTEKEKKQLSDMGVVDRQGSERLFLLNPRRVFRHTETRAQYEPFANVRMKSVFELLDLKHQLRQKDRAELIGATNFIVLIKKGSDQRPATQKEVNALQGYARTLARVPMLVGDHRLSVEIVTPKQDMTLVGEKYNALDARISARLYQMFMTGNYAAGAKGDDSIKLARVVARGLESRRHQLKRSLERNIWKQVTEVNEDFEEIPDLRFTPKRIALDFDANMATLLNELHMEGNLSRDTLLSELDFSEDEEARKRKRSKEKGYDDVFMTAVPFSSPETQPHQTQTPGAAGRSKGGTRNGGGAAPGTNQGKTKEQQADHDDEDDQ